MMWVWNDYLFWYLIIQIQSVETTILLHHIVFRASKSPRAMRTKHCCGLHNSMPFLQCFIAANDMTGRERDSPAVSRLALFLKLWSSERHWTAQGNLRQRNPTSSPSIFLSLLKATSPKLLGFRVKPTPVSGTEYFLAMRQHLSSHPAMQNHKRHTRCTGWRRGCSVTQAPYFIPPRKSVTMLSFPCKKPKNRWSAPRQKRGLSFSYSCSNEPELGSLGLDSVQFLFQFVGP